MTEKGSEQPISTRLPQVYVEYNGTNGQRVRRFFKNAHKAKAFYVSMFNKNRDPRVIRS